MTFAACLVDRSSVSESWDDWSSIVRVPDPAASFDHIIEFSHTFDAYGVHGTLERISWVAAEVWSARSDGRLTECTLDDLRTALFMTQSGWHHEGDDVDFAARLGYEWELVDAIHEASGGVVRDDRPTLY
jgi:hypothetical protein